jgi:hypothetical protein
VVLPQAAGVVRCCEGVPVRLFVGDDWAEDHHDVEVMDEAGTVLARRRLPEGAAGMAQLHALIGGCLGVDEDPGDTRVLVGIETDRGPWVAALVAAGYLVFPVTGLALAGSVAAVAARSREPGCGIVIWAVLPVVPDG